MLLTSLLQEQDSAMPAKHASAITVSLSLRETHTEDMAMQRLFCPHAKNNINVQERARSTFRQLCLLTTDYSEFTDLYGYSVLICVICGYHFFRMP